MSHSELPRTNPSAARAASAYRTVRLAAALVAIALSAGCGKQPATNAVADAPSKASSQASGATAGDTLATSPDLKRTSLMHAVFPTWKDTKKGNERIVDVELPTHDDQGHLSKALGSSQLDVTPREVIRLDDTHAVMLTEGVEVTDTGERVDAYASGAWLGAYFFDKQPSGWVLDKRIDGVSYDGVAGTYGETHVVRMSPTEFGFWSMAGGCWQGYCGTWASVFGIRPGRIERLAETLRVSASDLGAKGDCEDIQKGDDAPASGSDVPVRGAAQAPASAANDGAGSKNTGGDAAGTPQCFDIDGKLAFEQGVDALGDLRMTFSGEETIGQGSQVRNVDDVAVYRVKDGKYVLVEGRNPVPGF